MGLFKNLVQNITGGDSRELPLRLSRDGRLTASPIYKRSQNGMQQSYDDEVDEIRGKLSALDRVQAVAEFDLDGHLIDANTNFLETTCYSIKEIRGWHHSRLIPPGETQIPAHGDLWGRLKLGYSHVDHSVLRTSDGEELNVCIGYSPLIDRSGGVTKIMVFISQLPV